MLLPNFFVQIVIPLAELIAYRFPFSAATYKIPWKRFGDVFIFPSIHTPQFIEPCQ